MQRFGITIPFDGVPLLEQKEWLRELSDLGYTDFWSAESGGADGFTPLALAASWVPTCRVGSAIVPAYTRGAGTLASCVATLAEAAPGRAVFGIGSSSKVIVEGWNGIAFDKPYQRVRDTVRFLKRALTGEKVSEVYETFSVEGFRLARVPAEPPRIMIAALREGMLGLAGRESDGAILNWLSAEDVATVAPFVHAGGEGRELVARLFVLPSENRDLVQAVARRAIAAYLNVPVYAAFHQWLGRGEELEPMRKAWQEGDRKAAIEAIPERIVDALIIHGSPERCREHIQRYIDNGLHTPVLFVLPGDYDLRQASRELAPR
ncbi:MAG: LLM class F420-dependent oxidoreductase [Deltaproteobacteria bacterium]|nr:LLM class F420-dependent oxidoreductase [Deltaproteobacteria bacterium]MBW2418337.1 LLM class F420-dependent oxidoreductase [Deltaproteobacteria bacterium]